MKEYGLRLVCILRKDPGEVVVVFCLKLSWSAACKPEREHSPESPHARTQTANPPKARKHPGISSSPILSVLLWLCKLVPAITLSISLLPMEMDFCIKFYSMCQTNMLSEIKYLQV